MTRGSPGNAAGSLAHQIIRASAGTGKTFQLSNRFLALVCAGYPVDQVLAATFARKAAREIADRVLYRLSEAALDPARCDELAAHVEGAPDQAGCLALVKGLVQRMHRLRIGTLDSLFVQMAGGHSLELGLPAGWRVVDENVERKLQAQAVQGVLRNDSAGELLTLVRLLSRGDVTRSVTEQIAEVVSTLYGVFHEAPAAAWEALPDLPKLGSQQLAEAIEQLAGLEGSFTDQRIVKAHTAELDQARQGGWLGFVSNGLAGAIIDGKEKYCGKPIEPEVEAVYRPLIAHATAMLVEQLSAQTKATRRLLEKFDAVYSALKLRERAVRFDDICRVLGDGMSQGRVADVGYRLDAQLGHLLLDEFQDTSLLQWSVLRTLAGRVTSGADGQTLFCVGDVKQAIYGWRGGVSEIFDVVSAQYEGLTHRSLAESFRSSQVVIDTVNQVFSTLACNRALEGCPEVAARWAGHFEQHTTAKAGLAGYARLVAAPAAQGPQKQMAATLEFAAAEAARLSAQHPNRSVGVLVRTNVAVAHLIYELRARHHISASEEGGNPLTDSPAVQLVLSLFRLADHPGDNVARFHVATSPLGEFLGLADWRDTAAAERLSFDFRRWLAGDGYAPTVYRLAEHLAERCDERELNRLLELVNLCHEYEDQATGRTDDFVDYVAARKVEDPMSAPIRVMTIHQAKGLEFDIVILPELEILLKALPPRVVMDRSGPTEPVTRLCRYVNQKVQRLLPGDWPAVFEAWPRQAINESLCLLYVALTRAVHSLEMIVAPSAANERTWPKKLSGVLRSALAREVAAQPGTVLFAHGDPDWDSAEPDERPGRAAAELEHGQSPTLIRLAQPGPRRRGLKRESPSSLQGGMSVDLRWRLRPDTRGAVRGTLLHAWFECIEWLDDGQPDDLALLAAARTICTGGVDPRGELPAFRSALDLPAVRQCLSRDAGWFTGAATYDHLGFDPAACRQLAGKRLLAQVHREHPFCIRDDESLLQGAIDRLVLFTDPAESHVVAAQVIDFKTDQADSADVIDEKLTYYRPQMEAYCRAAAKLTGLPRSHVAACLLFVGPGVARTVMPPA